MAELPEDLPAAVFVVVHLSEEAPPHPRSRPRPLEAKNPEDGETFQKGRVYVARPDRHLLKEGGRVRSTHGPREKTATVRRSTPSFARRRSRTARGS